MDEAAKAMALKALEELQEQMRESIRLQQMI